MRRLQTWVGVGGAALIAASMALARGPQSQCQAVASCNPLSNGEGEPCGANSNGGCNSLGNPVKVIDCPAAICASFWWDGLTRDTDWYEITPPPGSIRIHIRVHSIVDTELFAIDASCPSTTHGMGTGDCPNEVVISTCDVLPPYRFAVVPSFSNPAFSCTDLEANYILQTICEPIGCFCGDPNAGSAAIAHDTPFCREWQCCEIVCLTQNDPYCCAVAWDALCVQRALEDPLCQTAMGVPQCPDLVASKCEAGCRDFARWDDGVEVANGSCSSGCSNFDELLQGGCFEHTLSGCWSFCGPDSAACGRIDGALLEVGLVKGIFTPAFPNGDTVTLLDGCSPIASGTLGGLLADIDSVGVLRLDLGALPAAMGGGSLLASLDDGELGIRVADETGVDFIALTVHHCPCATPESVPIAELDSPDGFTTVSPAHPSVELINWAAANLIMPMRIYDEPIPCDGVFLETITIPRTCTFSGQLWIGVRPLCSVGVADDTIGLELVDRCGVGLAWTMPLSALASAGLVSPPLAPSVTSVIALDLGSLPPDSNGVRDLRSRILDGSIDLVIEDDIGVDYVTLGVDTCLCPGDEFSGDLNGDGQVNGADITVLLSQWGPCPECLADLDGDDAVGGADITILLGNWSG